MTRKYLFKHLVIEKNGFLRGPFGGDLKKEIFVKKDLNSYKVYEQGVVLNSNKCIGSYYISENEYQKKLHKFSVQDKDFLISCSGVNMGAIYQLKSPFEKGIINQALLRIRLNNNIVDDNYFFYLFKKIINKKIILVSGNSTIPNFPGLGIIRNIEIELPSKEIQKKIGNILSALDAKIELNNRINAQLEAMAKTLYDYWFVQFDFPDANGKPYKTSGGKMVWNETLKREIPEGWGAEKMSEWIDIDKSGDWGKDEPQGNFTKKVICFRGADINGLNGLTELNPPVRYILEKNSFKLLKSHDLIIEISGGSPTQSTGRLAFITDATIKRFDYPLICSNFCKPISIRNKKLLYNFVYYWNSLYDSGVFFGYEGKTSGIKNLLLDSFIDSYHTVVPDDAVVNQFYTIMDNIQTKKQIALAENQKLTELRDWLLPMLMNGQVTVGNAYPQTQETTNIAAEPVIEYGTKPVLNIPENKKGFAKQVLAGKIVSLFKNDPNFTHIKFQKLQFLAEHIAEAELNLNYYFQAAGPYDNRFMHTIMDSFKKSKWFLEKDYKFIPLENQTKIEGYYQGYFSPVESKLKNLFTLLENTTEAQTEIIATLYAVWNNRIISQQPIEQEALINDFYSWSERKHQYTNQQVVDGLEWLKSNNFVPTGFGKLIKTAKSKK